MHSDTDPAQQSTRRKLRAFMGMLMNAEEALLGGGYNLSGAYQFALDAYERIAARSGSPESEAPGEFDRETERALFERAQEVIDVIASQEPAHDLLSGYQAYQARWEDCLARAIGTAHRPSTPAIAPTVYGTPIDSLLHLHAELHAEGPLEDFVTAFLIFLAGLNAGRRGPEVSDEWLYGQCLAAAVDFALQSEPQALARTMARFPPDTAFHCLFMGIAFVEQNTLPEIQPQLRRSTPAENLLTVMFGMGVRAPESSQARRLVSPVQPHLKRLIEENVGRREAERVISFS